MRTFVGLLACVTCSVPFLPNHVLPLHVPPLHAEGLLYKLPRDGAWVMFEMEFRQKVPNSEERVWSGTLKLSCVGRELHEGKFARWMEVDAEGVIDGEPKRIVTKVLIPEERLKAGETPTEHLIRGWLKEDERLQRFKPRILGPLPLFLAGPLSDVKTLAKETIETKLGALECEGVTGEQSYEEKGGQTRIVYTTRLHDKAPFGVVSTTIDMKNTYEGNVERAGLCKLELFDAGTGAKSALPNKH